MAGRASQAIQAPSSILIRRYLFWINGAALAGSAVFTYPGRDYFLVGLMLFLPLLDRGWRLPSLPRSRTRHLIWGVLLISGIALMIWRPLETPFAVAALLMAAIPEEWFFRAYFMTRLGNGWRANLTATLLFSLLHGLTQGLPAAIRVVAPSLVFGWLYQRTHDLPLLVLVHALSNILYMMFLAGIVATWAPELR